MIRSRTGPSKRDWALLAAGVAIGLGEMALRPLVSWSDAPVLVSFALLPAVLWRRSRPLLATVLAFGASTATSLLAGEGRHLLNATALLLVLPYSLLRWGSRREMSVGATVVVLTALVSLVSSHAPVSNFVGGFAVLLATMALGAAARSQAHARAQELEQVQLRERARLARDLHDTVAHHVSAIAIRAQAGLATAALRPEAATEALRVIESEATRTLSEMRAMVRLLRRDEAPDGARAPRIADLERLAEPAAEGPEVEVDISGDVDDVPPSVSAAIYHLARESITNARRHARHATRIEVGVRADAAVVHLSVSDDGEKTSAPPVTSAGYGLVGMAERVALLGGSCQAGPGPDRGWRVTAAVPRDGVRP